MGCRFRLVDSENIAILRPEFEQWMWRYLRLPRGGVFIDVGAYIGRYTIPAAKMVGSGGLVIALEPHPRNWLKLVENVRLNRLRNVIALQVAAWSEERTMRLFIGDVHSHHSLVRDFGRSFVLVKARPLDCIVEELGIGRVDFVKIDVEGAELEVLKGMRRILERFKPTVVAEVLSENKRGSRAF